METDFRANKLDDQSRAIPKDETKNSRDMVNYKVLEGHEYEIKENPDPNAKQPRIYICKYDNCNKTFSKTWNLVYHFRVHTKLRPYN